jgi:hypothetical protein
MNMNDALEVEARDLRLADVIRLGYKAFDTATVTRIENGLVTLFRPYVHTADFSTGVSVIAYIGIETFTVYQDSNRTYQVVCRRELA